jgi:hypothetical protein
MNNPVDKQWARCQALESPDARVRRYASGPGFDRARYSLPPAHESHGTLLDGRRAAMPTSYSCCERVSAADATGVASAGVIPEALLAPEHALSHVMMIRQNQEPFPSLFVY